MTLIDFTETYFSTRRVSPEYRNRVKARAKALQLFAGAATIEGTLTERVVTAFLMTLVCSAYTIRCYRGDLLSVWNAAADLDLVPYPIARRIVRIGRPQLLVECFTVDEARAILDEARKMTGCYPNGLPKRLYWCGAIPLAWDSGLRRGDVSRFRRDAVRPDRILRMIQGKTGKLHVARLRQSTLEALDAIGGNQPCRWACRWEFFGREFKRLVKASGVNRGTFKWLRRASGSYVDSEHPGAGYKHLGHADPQTFIKHYDAQLGGADLPMPPEL